MNGSIASPHPGSPGSSLWVAACSHALSTLLRVPAAVRSGKRESAPAQAVHARDMGGWLAATTQQLGAPPAASGALGGG